MELQSSSEREEASCTQERASENLHCTLSNGHFVVFHAFTFLEVLFVDGFITNMVNVSHLRTYRPLSTLLLLKLFFTRSHTLTFTSFGVCDPLNLIRVTRMSTGWLLEIIGYSSVVIPRQPLTTNSPLGRVGLREHHPYAR